MLERSVKKLTKPLIFGLVLALLPLGGLAASAMVTPQEYAVGQASVTDGTIDLEPEREKPAYAGLTGVVKEIIPMPHAGEHVYRVVMEGPEGEPFSFTVTDTTVFFTDARPEVGNTVTGFYDLLAPMIMIYPPQYTAVALGVETGDANLFVGHFDSDLVDADNRLMLIIMEDTRVQLPDGTPYEGSLKNRTLAVLYGASTRSIPAQTRPETVILLPEALEDGERQTPAPIREVPLPPLQEPGETAPSEDESESPAAGIMDLSGFELVVQGQRIENAPDAWMAGPWTVMVPLKAIAEALGFQVMWNGELRVVMLSDSFTVAIDEDAYVDMSRDEPISLGAPAVIRDGRSFVPLHFFRDVIPMNNAHVFEGQIVIDNQEPMH